LLLRVIFFVLSLFIISGCNTNNRTNIPPASAGTPNVADLTAEAQPAFMTAEPLEDISTTNDGDYYVAVSYAQEFVPEGVPAPPAGRTWLVVVATLGNQTGPAVQVTAQDLALIDEAGSRIAPEPPDDTTQPAMVGAVLAEGQSILGIARFAVPVGTTPSSLTLEWCPLRADDGPCPEPIRSAIP
jgi:hypothetical protein